MKTKAAIAHAAGQPLEVVTVDLDGPKAGEVLVQIHASGVCHTDEFTRSGADPEGLFPVIFGHEGAGVAPENHRSEEHTSELQSQSNLVCRLLLENKNPPPWPPVSPVLPPQHQPAFVQSATSTRSASPP